MDKFHGLPLIVVPAMVFALSLASLLLTLWVIGAPWYAVLQVVVLFGSTTACWYSFGRLQDSARHMNDLKEIHDAIFAEPAEVEMREAQAEYFRARLN